MRLAGWELSKVFPSCIRLHQKKNGEHMSGNVSVVPFSLKKKNPTHPTLVIDGKLMVRLENIICSVQLRFVRPAHTNTFLFLQEGTCFECSILHARVVQNRYTYGIYVSACKYSNTSLFLHACCNCYCYFYLMRRWERECKDQGEQERRKWSDIMGGRV